MPAATKPPRNRQVRRQRSKRQAQKRLTISIIGAGRLGTALGKALRRAGHRIELVVARRAANSRRAASLIGGDPLSVSAPRLLAFNAAARVRLLRSDVVIISTPDDALPRIAQQLSQTFREGTPAENRVGTRVALHTSGAISSEVLAPLRRSGLAVGSLHPLVAAAGSGASSNIFRGVHVCIEGNREAVSAASSIIRDIGGHSFTIDPNSKALYHAAAVMSAGHLVVLFDLAIEMLVECGLSARRAHQVLLPLLDSTAKNLSAKTTAQALTGPFARGDFETVKKHLKAIKVADIKDLGPLYALLGRRALRLRSTSSRNSEGLNRIAELVASQK
jgi:predicted short-subunit dehydrogenase-like oxidoreductase (DUF2520 family)